MARPLFVSFSGGKDSVLALARLRAAREVSGLVATFTEDDRTLVMHGVPERLVEAQAASLGLPLAKVFVPRNPSNDAYETRLAEAIAREGIAALAFGDLFLADIRTYRDALMARLGVEPIYPLWGEGTAALAHAFVREGYRAIAVCVDGERLDARFAGREMNGAFFAALPPGMDPCGENGEFHSFVYDGPGFAFPVPFTHALRRTDGRFQRAVLEPGPLATCARCAAPFTCGVRSAHCWCQDLPPVAPTDPAAGCYCPRCVSVRGV